jgi:exosortase/archaeosortase family protein
LASTFSYELGRRHYESATPSKEDAVVLKFYSRLEEGVNVREAVYNGHPGILMNPQNDQTPDSAGDLVAAGSNGAISTQVIGPRTVRSWIILGASLGLALALYYGFLGSSWVDVVAEWTATWTSKGINLLGGSTTVSGTLLISDNFVANVVAECTAIGPLILYTGAVVAYPASKRAKIVGVAAGAVVLTAVNLVRIMSLFWIGEVYPEYLDVAHLVWQSAIILLAIVMWLIWAGRLTGAAQR